MKSGQYARHDEPRIEFTFTPAFTEFDKRVRSNFGRTYCSSATASGSMKDQIFRVMPVISVFSPLVLIRTGQFIKFNLVFTM